MTDFFNRIGHTQVFEGKGEFKEIELARTQFWIANSFLISGIGSVAT